MRQILEALEYCHSKQVVRLIFLNLMAYLNQIHRDIKPSNVLVHFETHLPHVNISSDSCEVVKPTGSLSFVSASSIMDEMDMQLNEKGVLRSDTHDFLTKSIKVKLADFGLARVFPIPIRPLTHEVVTLWYRAPEIVLGFDHYTTAIDIWSTGCIFLELLYGRPVFSGDSEMETLYRTFQLLGTPTERDWPGVTRLPCWKPQWPVWPRRVDRYNYIREDLDAEAKDLLDQ